jgi:hypothetical protein
MSTSDSSPASTSAPEPDRVALTLAVLSAVMLWLGLFAWNFRYQSPLVLLPVAGAAMAPFALWHALHEQIERRVRTPMTRTAVALSVLPSFAPAAVVVCAASPWLGAPTILLAIGISFLPGRASARAPLLLGCLSVGALAVAWGMDGPEAALAVWVLGCLLALLGVQLGSEIVARLGRASDGVAYGIALSVATLVLPLILGMVYVATED